MLLLAAGAHDAASVPLLVIGGAWFLLGLGGLWQARHQVDEVVLHDALVEFRSPARTVAIPAAEIAEVIGQRRSYGSSMGYVMFQTRSAGVIRAVRPQNLFDLVVEIRSLNPDLKVKNL